MPRFMPDSEGEMSDAEEVIPGRKQVAAKVTEENGAERDEEEEEVEDDDDDDDDDDEEEPEVYQVEAIRDHYFDPLDKGIPRYQVKWLGWNKEPDDLTWETEENLEGAKEILSQYFKKIGGRPTNEDQKNVTTAKKRGRKSIGSQETPPSKIKKQKVEDETSSSRKVRSDGTKKPDGRGRRKSKQVSSSPPAGELQPIVIGSGWEPPKPKKDSWDDLVLSVETMERDAENVMWVFLKWAEDDEFGKKRSSKARLSTVKFAAPQAIIRFFESHLVFKSTAT